MDAKSDNALKAKQALETVCSGSAVETASCYYSPSFLDHVNDSEYRGLSGVKSSVELYRAILPDLSIRVEEQMVAGDSVTSRFTGTGNCLGRKVQFNGITISHFQNGLIVEDWSVTDTLGLLRQLGLWRALLVGIRNWKKLQTSRIVGLRTPRLPSLAVR